MSVIEGKNPTSLRMKFDLGLDELTQKTKVKSKTYSNLKTSALADDVLAVGEALANLVENEGIEVFKTEVSEAL